MSILCSSSSVCSRRRCSCWQSQSSGGGGRPNSISALLIVLCGMLTPFAIGYAGFYDRWPWLSFAPFAVPLAMGPLLYAHLNALVFDRPISRWHAALHSGQFAYQAVASCPPLGLRYPDARDRCGLWIEGDIQPRLQGPLRRHSNSPRKYRSARSAFRRDYDPPLATTSTLP